MFWHYMYKQNFNAEIPVGSFREILLKFLDPRLTYNRMVWLHCTMCGHEYNQKLYRQDTVKNNIKLHDENKISFTVMHVFKVFARSTMTDNNRFTRYS